MATGAPEGYNAPSEPPPFGADVNDFQIRKIVEKYMPAKAPPRDPSEFYNRIFDRLVAEARVDMSDQDYAAFLTRLWRELGKLFKEKDDDARSGRRGGPD